VSTPSRATRVPKAEARERIRGAAARLLTRGSYRDLSVDAVMAEAGLARTLFYRHFDGLPAVALSLLEEFRDSMVAGGDPTQPGYLRRTLEHAVDVAHRHGPLLRAIDDAARHDAEVERAYRGYQAWFTDVIAGIYRTNIASGLVRDVPDVDAAAMALNLMNGAFLLEAFGSGEDRVTPEVAVEVLWTIWARVLGFE